MARSPSARASNQPTPPEPLPLPQPAKLVANSSTGSKRPFRVRVVSTTVSRDGVLRLSEIAYAHRSACSIGCLPSLESKDRRLLEPLSSTPHQISACTLTVTASPRAFH